MPVLPLPLVRHFSLFSDKLICISDTPPASQPLSPPSCLSADCQKFIYLTPKKLTQTPVRRTTAYPATAPPHHTHSLGAWLVTRNETKSDLFACPKIGLQLSCNYATTKHREAAGESGGRLSGQYIVPTTTCHSTLWGPPGAPALPCMASNIF